MTGWSVGDRSHRPPRWHRTHWTTTRVAAGRILHLSGITAALSAGSAELVGTAVSRRRVPGQLVSFEAQFPALAAPINHKAD